MMRRMNLWVAIGIMAATMPGRAQQDENKQKPAEANATAAQAAPKKSATDDPNYVIGPQDVLDISVWNEPELHSVVPVRPDGKSSMPLLNDVQAAGRTPLQLTADITAGLKKFVTDPQVTVFVSTINRQRGFILGGGN